MRARASLIRFALNAPARPRLLVSSTSATRSGFTGCRSSGNRSARSGEYRLEITSESACAYGRAATTRSCARFIFEVATISIVRVILRVFSTERMRPLSSRPLAMTARDGLLVLLERPLEIRLDLLRQHLLGAETLAYLGELGGDELVQSLLPCTDLIDLNVVEIPVRHGIDGRDLLLHRHGLVLSLLQHFDRACTTLELALRGGVEVRRERRECLELAVLREVEAEAAGNRTHRLHLSGSTDAADGDTDVHPRTNARVAEVGL